MKEIGLVRGSVTCVFIYLLAFARSIVSNANFLSLSLLSIACSDAPATPPPPNLLPTRFYQKKK